MLAIFKKELRVAFAGLGGYIILSIFLLFFGLFTVIFNLFSGYTEFSYVLAAMQTLLIVLVPILVTGSLAKDRKNGTDVWLFSLPLSAKDVVSGKFWGLFALFAIPTVIASLYPILLSFFGEISLLSAGISFLGFLLIGTLLIAFCMLISLAIQRKSVAIALEIGIGMLVYSLDFLAAVTPIGVLSRALNRMAVFAQFTGFMEGYLDLSVLILYLSLTVLFLGLSILLVKLRSTGKRHGTNQKFAATVAVALLAAVLLNVLVGALPIRITQRNLAKLNDYRLSGISRDWLHTQSTDVELFLLCNGGKMNMDRNLYGFLEDYATASDHVTLRVIDTASERGFLKDYGDSIPSDNSVIVKSDKRYRILYSSDLYYYDVPEIGRCNSAEYSLLLDYLLTYDTTGATAEQVALETEVYFDGESCVTNAILFVSLDKAPHIYALESHETSALTSSVQTMLLHAGFALDPLSSLTSIPQDCDMLLLNAPATDLDDAERDALSAYLAGGGKLFLVTSNAHAELPKLGEVLAAYGMQFVGKSSDYLVENDPLYQLKNMNSNCFYASIDSTHGATGDFSDDFVVIGAHPIELTEVPNVKVTSWLHTSKEGALAAYDAEAQKNVEDTARGKYTFGAIAESGNTSITWIACGDAFNDTLNAYSSNGGNFQLILSAIQHMNGTDTDGITTAPIAVSQHVLTVNTTQFAVFAAVAVVILPALALLSGLAVRKRRQKL